MMAVGEACVSWGRRLMLPPEPQCWTGERSVACRCPLCVAVYAFNSAFFAYKDFALALALETAGASFSLWTPCS